MYRLKRSFMVAGVIAGVLGPGTAQAATLTLGNPLSAPGYATSSFGSSSTLINTSLIGGGLATSPTDGTVIGWGVGGAVGTFSLQVLHPVPGGVQDTGSSAAFAFASPGAPGPVQQTSLAIKQGELLGLSLPSGDISYSPTLGSLAYTDPAIAPGGTDSLEGASAGSFAFNATIRYCAVPSLIGLDLSRVTQALVAADCTLGQTVKPVIKKKKRRKLRVGSTIVAQTPAPGASIADTAPVNITFGVEKKKKKKKGKK